MKQFGAILSLAGLALAWPAAARAEPISVTLLSATSGVSAALPRRAERIPHP
jgi:hypothetical protein